MAEVYLIQKSTAEDLAAAIKEKTGETGAIKGEEFAAKIRGIETSKDTDNLIKKVITEFDSDVTFVGDYTFYKCNRLTEVNLPSATVLGDNSFEGCTKLSKFNAPLVVELGMKTFKDCTNLTEIDFPKGERMPSGYVFENCTSLTKVAFPKIRAVTSATFRGCSALYSADFYVTTSISASAFSNTILDALILRKTGTIVSLSNENAFFNTPIASGTGYIYVPTALVDSYKTAEKWSTFADQFRALEDYTVDGTITGDLDETKINA